MAPRIDNINIMALPSHFLRCVVSLLVLSPSIIVADVADTASTEWVDTQFGPPFRKAFKRFLLQAGSEDARTPRPVPTDLGPKIAALLRDRTTPGLLISASIPRYDDKKKRSFPDGKYDVLEGAVGLNDGSASLIGAGTPETYINSVVGGEKSYQGHTPGQMMFGWIAAPTTFVALCAYPTQAYIRERSDYSHAWTWLTAPQDQCGALRVLDNLFIRLESNTFVGPSWRPEPSQRKDALTSLQKALESEQEEEFAAFMLGKRSNDHVSWITPHLHAWAAEGRKTDAGLLSPVSADKRRDANGWLPFNEIVLTHQWDPMYLPQAVRPQALVYSFDQWHMNFEQEARKLKDLFQRQRAAISSLLEKDNVLPEAVFVGSDGKPDMLLVVVGLDSSLGVTKLSTAGAWVDKKVERWQQRKSVVDGASRSLGELLAECQEKNDTWFCWAWAGECGKQKLKLEEELKKLFGEEAKEPLFV